MITDRSNKHEIIISSCWPTFPLHCSAKCCPLHTSTSCFSPAFKSASLLTMTVKIASGTRLKALQIVAQSGTTLLDCMLYHNTSMIQACYQVLQSNASLGTCIWDPIYQRNIAWCLRAMTAWSSWLLHVSLHDSVALQMLHFTSAHVYIDCYAYAVLLHCCLANQHYRALLLDLLQWQLTHRRHDLIALGKH